MRKIQLPPFLNSGDTLEVIAPSGTLRKKELDAVEEGLKIWSKEGYNLNLSGNWQAQEGYLAGNDAIRRQA
jgi:muramoyltetrapeptide carboxypeptidase